jgi:hypothetical protein
VGPIPVGPIPVGPIPVGSIPVGPVFLGPVSLGPVFLGLTPRSSLAKAGLHARLYSTFWVSMARNRVCRKVYNRVGSLTFLPSTSVT